MDGDSLYEPEYVLARHVLLDALSALGPHRAAVVLVGAQAIYLRVRESGLAVAPYTTDGDLVVDPRKLREEPQLMSALVKAGFNLAVRPGTWSLHPTGVQIDLLVPAALSGAGRRGARLGAHGTDVARKATGLEAAVVDHSPMLIGSLGNDDTREFTIAVAGVAALLVAKLHKIYERKDDSSRLQDKDALDVLRLLRYDDTSALADAFDRLASHSVSSAVTAEARRFLIELFSTPQALGSQMAARSAAGIEEEEIISMSCAALAQALLNVWR